MDNRAKSFIWGVLFLLAGILFLLRNLDIIYFDMEDTWPVFLLIPGILFWYFWYIDRSNYRLLMPGTILIVYALYFFFEQQIMYRMVDRLWPVFILGPGLGFWAMYFLGSRQTRYFRSGAILVGFSVLFFILSLDERFFLPLLLIGIGVYLMMREKSGKSTASEGPVTPTGNPPASTHPKGDE
ncbi:MAG: hypothetical protein GXO78_03990 [Calditrichaeota bacterium]|nr:hypothetical protein [Calditrichota bacterium]